MFLGGIPTLPIGTLMTPATGDEMHRIEDWLREIMRQQGVMSETIGEVKGEVRAARERVEGIARIAHAANALAQRAVAHLEGKPLPPLPDETKGVMRWPMFLLVGGAFVAGITLTLKVLGKL